MADIQRDMIIGHMGETIIEEIFKKISNNVSRTVGKCPYDILVDGVKYDVKFDLRACSTGNLAVETVSREVDGVVKSKGWLIKDQKECDSYIYLTYDKKEKLLFSYIFTAKQLAKLSDGCKESPTYRNRGYLSRVKLLPIQKVINTGRSKLIIPLVGDIPEETIKGFTRAHKLRMENKK